MDTDPIVRMHLNEMIAQVPKAKQYRKRHLDSVAELLRLVIEVLTMAPEFGDQNATLPLAAILDWTMGTSAGFAAYRDHPHHLNQAIGRYSNVDVAHRTPSHTIRTNVPFRDREQACGPQSG